MSGIDQPENDDEINLQMLRHAEGTAASNFRRVMQGLFGSLTTRGWLFLAAGIAAVVCGLSIPEPDLVRVGALLLAVLPVSALTVRGSRCRVSCSRRLDSPRVPAGQPTAVTARVANVSRLPTGVLIAEDAVPAALGRRPRFVLDPVEPGGHRDLAYQIRSPARGKFTVGPLRIRVADAFGLVEVSRSFGAASTLLVTPAIVSLPRTAAGSRPGDGDGGMRTISLTGEDDAAPRAYRNGDGLRRVHWRSTARHGELMVRREEGQWGNSASVLLDTRRCAHAGSGQSSSFEVAVSAAASIGAHLVGQGLRTRLITEDGEIAPQGTSPDSVLDMLAVISPSGEVSLRAGISALACARGQLIAVAGCLSAVDADQLAAVWRGTAPAMALLLAAPGWASDAIDPGTAHAAGILSAAGWRVAVVTGGAQLAAALQDLHAPFEPAARPPATDRPGGEPR